MEAKLVVLSGKAKGNEIPLPSSQFVIGRGSVCHLRPHSELVSKLHCVIGRRAGHVVVRDLKSANRTFINNKAINGTVRVQDGDILSVGPLQFRFSIAPGPDDSLVQRIKPDEVHWLMKESADSFVMDSDYETKIVKIPPHLSNGGSDSDSADAATSEPASQQAVPEDREQVDDKTLSAGRYLHEYFQSNGNAAQPPEPSGD